MFYLVVAYCALFVAGAAVEHATDIEIQQVEVFEIPWEGGTTPPPKDTYGPPPAGAPQNTYGPPPVYGPPPEETTTTESASTTTELPTTTETVNQTTGRLEVKKDLINQGSYYIYHPDGVLQKVVYSTKDDEKKMEYSAKLKYENVQPVRGPIYTYDAKTALLSRIHK